MASTEFDPESMSTREFYKLLTSVIVPRPIAWVSSTSAAGVDNLAPHSFFTVACVDPPVVQFTSVGRKDSLRNIEATGEFVVNLTPESLFEQVNATATDFPDDLGEFEAVGVRGEPGKRVRPQRVVESPVALECRFHGSLCLGDSYVVLGKVVHAAVHEDVMDGDHPEITKLKPLARLGINEWSTIGEVRATNRIAYSEWPGHYQGGQ